MRNCKLTMVRAMLAAAALWCLLVIPAAAQQCGVRQVFDPANLAIGQNLSQSGSASATSSVAGGNVTVPNSMRAQSQDVLIQQLMAALAEKSGGQVQVMQAPHGLAFQQSQGTTATATAGGGGPRMLLVDDGGGSAAASASATAAAPQQIQAFSLPAVALNPASASSASSVSNAGCSGGSCGGGRAGILGRRSRTRTATRTNVNGNRSSASSVTVSR